MIGQKQSSQSSDFRAQRRLAPPEGTTIQSSESGCQGASVSCVCCRTWWPNRKGAPLASSSSLPLWYDSRLLRATLCTSPGTNVGVPKVTGTGGSSSSTFCSESNGRSPKPTGKIAATTMKKMLPATGTLQLSPEVRKQTLHFFIRCFHQCMSEAFDWRMSLESRGNSQVVRKRQLWPRGNA